MATLPDQGELVPIDWARNRELLLKVCEPIVRGFVASRQASGEVVLAIGYAFEFGTKQLCFDMCANTAREADAAQQRTNARNKRWNSGDYNFPGGVQEEFGDWGDEWWDELRALDRLAEKSDMKAAVKDGITEICCQVLAELASGGVLGDWTTVDFNVAALLDKVEVIEQRDGKIRKLIQSASKKT